MAITFTELVETPDTTGGTSSPSGSYTPTANTPCIAVVIAPGTVDADPTFTGNGLTWTLRLQQLWGASDVNSLYVFDSPGAASPSTGAGTFDCTGDASTGTIIQVVEIGGAHATTPFVQRVDDQNPTPGTGTTPFVLFATTAADSALFVAVANLSNPAAHAITGWTELMDTGFATPTTGGESTYNVAPGVTTLVTWNTATRLQWGTIGYEIAPAPSGLSMTLGMNIGF